jgi:HK97 gp10 family phage protein
VIIANITGAKELEAQLLELNNVALAVKVIAAAARKAFLPVIEDARGMVPTDSTALRDSIKITTKKSKDGDAVVIVGLKIAGPRRNSRKWFERRNAGEEKLIAPKSRWHFVEFGAAHNAAHPFIRPALDRNATKIVMLLKEELVKGIARAVKKQARADAGWKVRVLE